MFKFFLKLFKKMQRGIHEDGDIRGEIGKSDLKMCMDV